MCDFFVDWLMAAVIKDLNLCSKHDVTISKFCNQCLVEVCEKCTRHDTHDLVDVNESHHQIVLESQKKTIEQTLEMQGNAINDTTNLIERAEQSHLKTMEKFNAFKEDVLQKLKDYETKINQSATKHIEQLTQFRQTQVDFSERLSSFLRRPSNTEKMFVWQPALTENRNWYWGSHIDYDSVILDKYWMEPTEEGKNLKQILGVNSAGSTDYSVLILSENRGAWFQQSYAVLGDNVFYKLKIPLKKVDMIERFSAGGRYICWIELAEPLKPRIFHFFDLATSKSTSTRASTKYNSGIPVYFFDEISGIFYYTDRYALTIFDTTTEEFREFNIEGMNIDINHDPCFYTNLGS